MAISTMPSAVPAQARPARTGTDGVTQISSRPSVDPVTATSQALRNDTPTTMKPRAVA